MVVSLKLMSTHFGDVSSRCFIFLFSIIIIKEFCYVVAKCEIANIQELSDSFHHAANVVYSVLVPVKDDWRSKLKTFFIVQCCYNVYICFMLARIGDGFLTRS